MSLAVGVACAKMQKCRLMKEQCPSRTQQAEDKVRENCKVRVMLGRGSISTRGAQVILAT